MNNAKRVGLGQNFSRAIAACTGELIALSDQDDIWRPGRLLRLVAGLGTSSLVYCKTSEVITDNGSIRREHLFERMHEFARRYGSGRAIKYLLAENWVVSHSSLYGLGAPPAEPRGWRANIRDSERRGTRVAEVHLRDSSLTTSGTGEKCFWSGGTLYSHILDPRTGWPLQSITQVSVWAPKAVDGEVWAKACLLNGPEWVAGRKPDTVKVLTDP